MHGDTIQHSGGWCQCAGVCVLDFLEAFEISVPVCIRTLIGEYQNAFILERFDAENLKFEVTVWCASKSSVDIKSTVISLPLSIREGEEQEQAM